MEVTEPRNIHIETRSDDGLIRVLLSDEWADLFQKIYDKLFETGLVSIELDFLEELADRFIGFLSLDLGPVSASLGLMSLALYKICDKMDVNCYEVARTPAITGKAKTGKTRHRVGGYKIEPVSIE